MLLGLGEFGDKDFAPAERDALLPKLLNLYRTDPDPGLHAAAAWLLGKWGRRNVVKQIDRELVGKPAPGRRWYVNGQGQTYAVSPARSSSSWARRARGRTEAGTQGPMESLHLRRIGRTFAIATHEVTVAQFLALPQGPRLHPAVRTGRTTTR